MIEFELSDDLISIKQIDQFKPLSHFKIKGCGDLSWRSNTNKKGYGFEVHNESAVKEKSGRWTTKITTFFFTNEEMQELFIHSHIYYDNPKQIERDLKIKQILK